MSLRSKSKVFRRPTQAAAWALLAVCGFLGGSGSRAQEANLLSSSYITPFPQGDRYHLRVIGDWLGTGLASGLQEAFKNDTSLEIADVSRPNYGLARAEQTHLFADVDTMLSGTPVHIAVVMLGVNDRASLRTQTGRALPGSEDWKEVYGKEAEKLVKKLRGANIAVYWVGLPVMGNAAFNDDVAAMNDAVRQAAFTNGAKFIDTAAGFTDQLGAYSAFGPDITGQVKRLRENDGIGLTPAGNRKLANYVEIAIRRDLAQARAQRNVPLAGDEEEQARIVPGGVRNALAKTSAAAGKQEWHASTAAGQASGGKPDAGSKPASGFKTELSSSPAPATDSTRRDQAAFASAGDQLGEYILSDLGNGLTSIAVISPVNEFSMREIQRQTPLADRLYFKVLSKGDALPPKQGRADDFRWHGDRDLKSQ